MTVPDGLAAERVVLAWSRTALVAFVDAGLLALREASGRLGPFGLLVAGFAVLSAVVVHLACLRRGRVLRHRCAPSQVSPRRQVLLVGSCVFALSLACVFAA